MLNWAGPHSFPLRFPSSVLSPLPSLALPFPPGTLQVLVREAGGEGAAKQFGRWQSLVP